MKLDTSAAPELALLAQDRAAAAPATVGYLAACLRRLEADPQSWWDLVRFDPALPVQVAVTPPGPGCEAWLLVLPPGYRGDEMEPGQNGADQGWEVACLVAGEIAEQASTPDGRPGRPLLPGRIRVRGSQESRHLINVGTGYAVSLHARSIPARPGS
jgi:hypothetical protein